MKFFVTFFSVFSAVFAKRFELSGPNRTCALLDVEGTVEIRAFNDAGDQVGDIFFADIDDFYLAMDGTESCQENSNPIALILNYGVVNLWFWFLNYPGPSGITQKIYFNPIRVDKQWPFVNDFYFEAEPFGNFYFGQSLKCMTLFNHNFTTSTHVPNMTFEVNVLTNNFQVQLGTVNNHTFGPQILDCAQDLAPLPSPGLVNVTLFDNTGNVCLSLEGFFIIEVPLYYIKDLLKTDYLFVPSDSSVSGNCSYNDTVQSLNLGFAKDWQLGFVFSKISNVEVALTEMNVTYTTSVFGVEAPQKTLILPTINSPKTRIDGFFKCTASNSLANMYNVNVSASEFKFKAFSNDSDGTFSGPVSDCTGKPHHDHGINDMWIIAGVLLGVVIVALIVLLIRLLVVNRRRRLLRRLYYNSL